MLNAIISFEYIYINSSVLQAVNEWKCTIGVKWPAALRDLAGGQ